MKKARTLKQAVIGVGNMGRHHARVYAEMGDVQLVGIADIHARTGRAIASKYRCAYYKDYQQMLDTEKPDAVTIAVPTSLHREVALACIDRHIAVLIEKPIAGTIASAQQIIQAAREHGTMVCVGHIERYNPAVRKLKELITANRFGRIVSINTKRVGLYPPQITDTDVVVDLAVHDIDVCNYLLAKAPASVYARAGKALNSRRFDYSDICLNYDGVTVTIQVNWITPVKVRELTLTGLNAYAEINYVQQTLRVYRKGHGEDVEVVNVEEINFRKEEPLKVELTHFVAQVRGGKGQIVTAEEGVIALKVALSALYSHRSENRTEILKRDL